MGIPLDFRDNQGKTALFYALEAGHAEMADVLIFRGANPSFRDKNDVCPLDVTKDNEQLKNAVLASGSHLFHTNSQPHSFSPLLILLTQRISFPPPNLKNIVNLRMAPFIRGDNLQQKKMLESGLDVRFCDFNGTTVLHTLANWFASLEWSIPAQGTQPNFDQLRANYLHLAEILIERKARILARDVWGRTPLHYAVKTTFGQMAALLLSHGADVNARDHNDCTPLHLAVSIP